MAKIHLTDEDIEFLLSHLDSVEKEVGEIRGLLSGRFQFKNKNSESSEKDNDVIKLDIDVSGIEFKQKGGAIAGPHAMWGWCFGYTQEGDFHPESKELVLAIEQYGKVQVGNRIYSLGGRDSKLLQMKGA